MTMRVGKKWNSISSSSSISFFLFLGFPHWQKLSCDFSFPLLPQRVVMLIWFLYRGYFCLSPTSVNISSNIFLASRPYHKIGAQRRLLWWLPTLALATLTTSFDFSKRGRKGKRFYTSWGLITIIIIIQGCLGIIFISLFNGSHGDDGTVKRGEIEGENRGPFKKSRIPTVKFSDGAFTPAHLHWTHPTLKHWNYRITLRVLLLIQWPGSELESDAPQGQVHGCYRGSQSLVQRRHPREASWFSAFASAPASFLCNLANGILSTDSSTVTRHVGPL